MKKILSLFLILFISHSFALTLEQVKTSLKENFIPQDAVEMNLRVSVKTMGVYQQTDIYIVNKGIDKSYTEIKSSFLNQRSIVNGNKMKIVDLKTNKTQILDYDASAIKSNPYSDWNPLDSGDWGGLSFFRNPLYHTGS